MNFLNPDWRDRRHILNHGISYGPMHYTIANYSTNTKIKETTNMKPFEEEIMNKIHSIPDPLRKNLADTVITADKYKEDPPTPVDDKEFYYEPNFPPNNMEDSSNTNRNEFYSSLTGITTFFTNVFGAISGAVFHRRPKSPVSQYYDCFECDSHVDQKMAADIWQSSKNLDENKRATSQTDVVNDNMSYCRAAVAQCEDKINAVKNLLKNKTVPATTNTKIRYRRPRKAFVEAGSVQTNCEEEFPTDNYVSLSNEEYVEYFALPNNNSEQFCDIKPAKMKTELASTENTDVVSVFSDVTEKIRQNVVPEKIEESAPLVIGNMVVCEKIEESIPLFTKSMIECEKIEESIKLVTQNMVVPEKIEDKTPLIAKNMVLHEKIEKSTPLVTKNTEIDEKKEVISSCEDKMAKLKAMLQDKRNTPRSTNSSVTQPLNSEVATNSKATLKTAIAALKPTAKVSVNTSRAMNQQPKVPNLNNCKENLNVTTPTPLVIHKPPIKPSKVVPIDKKQNKHYKNPHRLTDKRKKSKMRKCIQDDCNFAQEINSQEISSSVDSSNGTPSMPRRYIPIPSPKDCFDEMKGKFQSATPDSDDSFQIVFADSPKMSRMRRPSDCDSEDSFIIFEDSPDSCYTSTDVFGDATTTDDSETDLSDSESEISDSGCSTNICKLSHSLSRTISDLTDDSLYEDVKIEKTNIVEELSPLVNDEVDCAVSFRDIDDSEVSKSDSDNVKRGLLLDEERKLKKKGQPPKKVSFSEKPPAVRVMRVWAYAARQARAGHWERHALDRERFKRRIADVDMAVSWVLKPQHRSRVMFQRFMPWWNQQKRKEAADKKRREEEERIKKVTEDGITEEFKKEVSLITEYDDICFFYNGNIDIIQEFGLIPQWKKIEHRCSRSKKKNIQINNVIATVET